MENENKQKGLPRWAFISIIVGGVVALILGVIGIVYAVSSNFGNNYKPEDDDKVEIDPNKEIKTIFAQGRSLYDKDGNRFVMKGVNFGNWLIQEGWMTVNSVGIEYNEDGSYKKVNEDGIIESYYEVAQDDVTEALRINPNLTDAQIDSLWDAYYASYCQEEDFINIKNLGLNTIRLPMYYRTFMEGPDDNLTMKQDAFKLVDWFLGMAKKHDLFVVLDMHGVVGGNNGFEHSGTWDCEFWENEHYQEQMCTLWQNIAKHYVVDRPDLAYTIATYDLVNEPCQDGGNTNEKQWKVFDKMYDAIREVDKEHVITMESVWFCNNLPDPKDYGWENVMYEYHFYNWNRPQITNDMFYTAQWNTLMSADYEVPKYIGEFTFFDEKAEWIKWLNKYDEMGFNWTFWSYKTISVGYWDTSWGLYVYKMNLFNEQKKLDLRTATYDEIMAQWAHQGTSETYTSTGITKTAIEEYFAQLGGK